MIQENEIRYLIREWLEQNWDPDLSRRVAKTTCCRTLGCSLPWPKDWFAKLTGTRLPYPVWADEIVRSEILLIGAVSTPIGAGMNLAAPTILKHGGEDQKRRFLEPALTGQELWCQLFSEPGAGSDLAGLTTQAQLDGDGEMGCLRPKGMEHERPPRRSWPFSLPEQIGMFQNTGD